MPAAAAVEPVIHEIAELHERRQRAAEALFVADHRTVARIRDRRVVLPARHHPGLGHAVRAVLRIPAPQHGEPLQPGGHVRTNFGELHAGNRRVDRPELAAHAGRCVGLGIERVVMARAAVRPDQDAVDVLRRVVAACGRLAPSRTSAATLPNRPSAPTRKKLRRDIPSQVREEPKSRSSMAVSEVGRKAGGWARPAWRQVRVGDCQARVIPIAMASRSDNRESRF